MAKKRTSGSGNPAKRAQSQQAQSGRAQRVSSPPIQKAQPLSRAKPFYLVDAVPDHETRRKTPLAESQRLASLADFYFRGSNPQPGAAASGNDAMVAMWELRKVEELLAESDDTQLLAFYVEVFLTDGLQFVMQALLKNKNLPLASLKKVVTDNEALEMVAVDRASYDLMKDVTRHPAWNPDPLDLDLITAQATLDAARTKNGW